MPEPEKRTEDGAQSDKPSKVLQFFSTPVKEQKKEKVKPLSKVVIRRLPPRLTKEAFLSEIVLPPHDFFYFVRGDLNLGPYAFSRAYINFTNPDDIYAFREKYDDHPLPDEQGREYHAVVEWAPQQRIPKKTTQKKLSKSGTLEADPKYIEFLEKLEQEKNSPGNTSEYFMETDSVTTKEVKVTTTPLLEYIKLKRQQKIDIRNENRIRKREAEKEKRRKEDDMRRAEKQRKEKDKPSPKEVKVVEQESAKPAVKEGEKAERKKSEPKSPRIAKNEVKSKEEKFEKKPKAARKPEETRISRGEDKTPKPVSSRKVVVKDEKPVPPSPSEGKSRSSADLKRESVPASETKSKFRYSEQRNRDRNQKSTVDSKAPEDVSTAEKEDNREETKDQDGLSRQSTQDSDGSMDGDDIRVEGQGGRKDPRVERKIRNKDRPTMQIYRPGMGRFSKQRIDVKKGETDDVKGEDVKEEPSSKPERIKDSDIKPFKTKKVLDNSDLRVDQPALIVKKLHVIENQPDEAEVIPPKDDLNVTETTIVSTDITDNKIDGELEVLTQVLDNLEVGVTAEETAAVDKVDSIDAANDFNEKVSSDVISDVITSCDEVVLPDSSEVD